MTRPSGLEPFGNTDGKKLQAAVFALFALFVPQWPA
jgi:hypothetical protein